MSKSNIIQQLQIHLKVLPNKEQIIVEAIRYGMLKLKGVSRSRSQTAPKSW
jgi:hypothetical protein